MKTALIALVLCGMGAGQVCGGPYVPQEFMNNLGCFTFPQDMVLSSLATVQVVEMENSAGDLKPMIQTLAATQKPEPSTPSTPKKNEPKKKGMQKSPKQNLPFEEQQPFPLDEQEVFPFPPIAPQQKQFSLTNHIQIPTNRLETLIIPQTTNSTSIALLKPGIYLAEPYSMQVIAPEPGADHQMLINPDKNKGQPALKEQIPMVKPELRLVPVR